MKGFLQNIMGKKLVRIILALFLFCFVVTSIYPLIWLVFFSFKRVMRRFLEVMS